MQARECWRVTARNHGDTEAGSRYGGIFAIRGFSQDLFFVNRVDHEITTNCEVSVQHVARK